jgi:ribosomal protein S11
MRYTVLMTTSRKTFTTGRIEVPSIDVPKVRAAARDAAYLVIGAGVVAADEVRSAGRRVLGKLDVRVDGIESRVEAAFDRLEGRLPAVAGQVIGQVRDVTRVAGQQMRNRIRPAA